MRPIDFEEFPIPFSPCRGDGNVFFAGKISTGDGLRAIFDRFKVPLSDDGPSVDPGPRPMSTK